MVIIEEGQGDDGPYYLLLSLENYLGCNNIWKKLYKNLLTLIGLTKKKQGNDINEFL